MEKWKWILGNAVLDAGIVFFTSLPAQMVVLGRVEMMLSVWVAGLSAIITLLVTIRKTVPSNPGPPIGMMF